MFFNLLFVGFPLWVLFEARRGFRGVLAKVEAGEGVETGEAVGKGVGKMVGVRAEK